MVSEGRCAPSLRDCIISTYLVNETVSLLFHANKHSLKTFLGSKEPGVCSRLLPVTIVLQATALPDEKEVERTFNTQID